MHLQLPTMVQRAQPANHVVHMGQRLGDGGTVPVLARHGRMERARLLAEVENLLPRPSRPAQQRNSLAQTFNSVEGIPPDRVHVGDGFLGEECSTSTCRSRIPQLPANVAFSTLDNQQQREYHLWHGHDPHRRAADRQRGDASSMPNCLFQSIDSDAEHGTHCIENPTT